MTNKTTINAQALLEIQATPLEQARAYLYQNLRTLERNAKPKGVAVQVRIAVDGFVRQSEQARSILADELAASRHHATGLKSYNDELLTNIEVHRDAYDNQKTLTRNALIESRSLFDQLWEVRGELEQAKQQAGDAQAARDVIDRLRSYINRLEATVYSYETTISTQAEQLLAKDQRITEICSDVRNAENYSDQLSQKLAQKDVVNKSMGAECDLLTGEVERQKEAVQQLLKVNGELREAAGIAGDHVRAQNERVGAIYEILTDAQAQLTEYLIGNFNEAMRSFDASPGDENCELRDVLNAKDA